MSDPPSTASAPREIPDAHRALFASLYRELREIAYRELRRARGTPISATTLLHEAYFKVQDQTRAAFVDQRHFLSYATRVIRSLVIDFARHHQAIKRGGAVEITSLPTAVPEQSANASELERVEAAVDELAQLDEGLAELVNLKFFCGMTFVEIASVRAVSERTVQRDWEKARVLLQRALEGRDLLSG